MNAELKGVDKVLAALNPKQAKFAQMVAINNTAFGVRKSLRESLNTYLDIKQDSFADKAFQVKKATKTNLNATVYLREDSLGKGTKFSDVYGQHFHGGDRNLKRFEKALVVHNYMTSDHIAVRGKHFKGKLSASLFSRLMSYLQMHYKAGYSANMTKEGKAKIEKRGVTKKGYNRIGGKAYFVIPHYSRSHLQPGIYQKRGVHGADIVPIIVFLKKGKYKKRIDAMGIADETVQRMYKEEFKKAWDYAIKTAKK